MAYATQQNMIDRFSEKSLTDLTDRVAPYTGAIVDTVLNQALSDAAQEMDGYLRVRYSLPLQIETVPDLLRRINCVIAYYYLHQNGIPDDIELRYKDARKQLSEIRDRKLEIGIDELEPAPASSEIVVTAPDRVFNADTMKGF